MIRVRSGRIGREGIGRMFDQEGCLRGTCGVMVLPGAWNCSPPNAVAAGLPRAGEVEMEPRTRVQFEKG